MFLVASPSLHCLSENIDDYPEGIIIPVDKPYRWTSADVIRKVKFAAIRHFHKKNLKVGHAGTLDPLATGVLLVCLGKATKMAETLQKHDKEYVADVVFGATTPSYDLEKPIDRFYPTEGVTEEALRAVLPSFQGEQEQVAPLFSAKSVDGVRAYELARKLYRSGGDIDETALATLTRQRITISEISLLEFTPGGTLAGTTAGIPAAKCGFRPEKADDVSENGGKMTVSSQFSGRSEQSEGGGRSASSRINVTDNSALGLPHASIRVACSKGTYIRALARDLGEALGTGAHLGALCRTRTGDFRVEDALSVDEAVALLAAGRPRSPFGGETSGAESASE